MMKKLLYVFLFSVCLLAAGVPSSAQCSVCTRTAEQLGEKSAKGLNAGILYLALTPFAIAGIVGYRWWKKNA